MANMAPQSVSHGSRIRRRKGTWNRCCDCFFSPIPDDILSRGIFSFLSIEDLNQAVSVCTLFRMNVESDELWRSVNVASLPHFKRRRCIPLASNVPDDDRAFVLSESKELVRAEELMESYLRKLVRRKQLAIRCLYLNSCIGLSDDAICRMFDTLSNLEVVDLGGCIQVSEKTLVKLISGKNCKTLRVLRLNSCNVVSDDCLKLIGTHCSQLEELNLSNCGGVTVDGLRALAGVREGAVMDSPECMWSLGETEEGQNVLGCSKLRILDLTACARVDGSKLSFCIKSWRLLEKLSLRAGARCDDQLLSAIGQSCGNLKILDLSCANPFGGNVLATDAGLMKVARGCSYLEELRIKGLARISVMSLQHLNIFCRRLRILDAQGCVGLRNSAPAMKVLIDNMDKLESLNVMSALPRSDQEAVLEVFREKLRSRAMPRSSTMRTVPIIKFRKRAGNLVDTERLIAEERKICGIDVS